MKKTIIIKIKGLLYFAIIRKKCRKKRRKKRRKKCRKKCRKK